MRSRGIEVERAGPAVGRTPSRPGRPYTDLIEDPPQMRVRGRLDDGRRACSYEHVAGCGRFPCEGTDGTPACVPPMPLALPSTRRRRPLDPLRGRAPPCVAVCAPVTARAG